jgi:hypothetical protein
MYAKQMKMDFGYHRRKFIFKFTAVRRWVKKKKLLTKFSISRFIFIKANEIQWTNFPLRNSILPFFPMNFVPWSFNLHHDTPANIFVMFACPFHISQSMRKLFLLLLLLVGAHVNVKNEKTMNETDGTAFFWANERRIWNLKIDLISGEQKKTFLHVSHVQKLTR